MQTYTGSNLTTHATAATALINSLRAAGLTPKYVNAGSTSDAAGSMTATKATFEFTPDALVGTQPWRVQIDGSQAGYLYLQTGTAAQLTDAGASNGQSVTLATGSTLNVTYPNSYQLTVATRGLALAMYASNQANYYVGLAVIQRPVHAATGVALTTGNAPVFMVSANASTGAAGMAVGVVREADITTWAGATPPLLPQTTVSAAQTLPDGSFWVQAHPPIATARYLYTEQLDLLQFGHASAFPTGNDVPMTVYGEGSARTYRTVNSLGAANSLRPMLLTAGGPA